MLQGHPIRKFTYGKPTGIFDGENEFRIGFDPNGVHVALSTKNGEFPVEMYVDENGKYVDFETEEKALEFINSL